MEQTLQQFGMGIKFISETEEDKVDLGPLTALEGTWKSKPGDGWNVIAVPGQSGFVLEVIPYVETLSFKPVVVALNRGPFAGKTDSTGAVQSITGLMYEQIIISDCDTDFCQQRGFAKGTMIHGERGLFLNVKNFNDGFDVVRLATIPHGNALLALGQSSEAVPPNNDFFAVASTKPTLVGGGRLPLGYSDIYDRPQFPGFNQVDPNTILRSRLGDRKINAMTTLQFSTTHSNGGILNIPFIQQNIDATQMDSIFWIENLDAVSDIAGAGLQLQYTQTINLVFPATGSKAPINWPHVTVNTLIKVNE
ncbi:hypothetical protein EPD60_00355 [Flaviaesturariibacter flavus]|uniref:Uncharacterized protein n=1 Tax=Flaviaesturariibacter flavus TaxID=2502780 RepID=A0A4R1BPQ1_9BACT|nr:heme-binding protein [Flaviaesturariibacter flavus]TCJ19610.1 hypothetical protein EPD60_00355 [Flaviaesturariibacter flavus]